jgi:hypothetical protein
VHNASVHLGVENRADEGGDLGEILLPSGGYSISRRGRVDFRAAGRMCVERRHRRRHRVDARLAGYAAGYQGGQAAVFGHAAHLEQMLADSSVRRDNVENAQVHIRSEAPVQRELAVKDGTSLLERGEIEERELHRLLHLVGPITDEENDRAVCLDDGSGRCGLIRVCHQSPVPFPA